MKKDKFTFKKQKPITGLAGVGCPYPDTTIYFNRDRNRTIGYIDAPTWETKDRKWRIRLMVKTGNSNWNWITLKAKFDTEPEVREFLLKNQDAIVEKYDLYECEDWMTEVK